MQDKNETWFVLSNAVGTILGVYGSALEIFATQRGREIRKQSACCVALHKVIGNKPSVYGSISMTGPMEWL